MFSFGDKKNSPTYPPTKHAIQVALLLWIFGVASDEIPPPPPVTKQVRPPNLPKTDTVGCGGTLWDRFWCCVKVVWYAYDTIRYDMMWYDMKMVWLPIHRCIRMIRMHISGFSLYSVEIPCVSVCMYVCIVLYCIVLYCIALYCIVLCRIVLYCIVMYCNVL